MNEKQRLLAVYRIIKKNDRITFNKLHEQIKKIGDGMAKNTLRNTVNLLIGQGKIVEIRESGKQTVLFTDRIQLVKQEASQVKKFKRILKQNKKRLQDLKKILDSLYPADAYFMFSRFVRLFWPMDLLFYQKKLQYYDEEFTILFKEYDLLKKEFSELVNDAFSKRKLTQKSFVDSITYFSKAAESDFDADLDEFLDELNHDN